MSWRRIFISLSMNMSLHLSINEYECARGVRYAKFWIRHKILIIIDQSSMHNSNFWGIYDNFCPSTISQIFQILIHLAYLLLYQLQTSMYVRGVRYANRRIGHKFLIIMDQKNRPNSNFWCIYDNFCNSHSNLGWKWSKSILHISWNL